MKISLANTKFALYIHFLYLQKFRRLNNSEQDSVTGLYVDRSTFEDFLRETESRLLTKTAITVQMYTYN